MKKIIVLVLLLLVVGYFAYQSPYVARFLPQQPKQILHQTFNKATPKSNKTLYKWRDPQGQLQVTDKPPTSKIPYEKLEYP